MRAAVVALLACGCRQLLGLDDLPAHDASVDARVLVDADPTMLALTHVTPATILEGTGTESRPAVIVVHGMHIVPGATVELSSHDFGSPITVDPAVIQVSRDGTMLAFPYVVPVESILDANARFRIDVTVSQQAGTEVVTRTLTELAGGAPVLEVIGLDELTGANVTLPPGVHQYSRVEVASIAGTLGGPGGPDEALIIRATSTVSLAGTSTVSASGKTGGPGAGDGGAGGPNLGGPGEIGGGPGGGLPSGGGASYATKGGGNSPAIVGDPALTSFAANRGSGGAGGNGGPTSPGGAGGGGGGTIEISANGKVEAATILARGGSGANGQEQGGGGSGGTILLRSAISVSAITLDANGGVGKGGGGIGRIRIDAPQIPTMSDPAFYRGPSFAIETPSITTEAQPTWTMNGQPLTTFKYYFATADRTQLRGAFQATFSATGVATLMAPEPLYEGFNFVCLVVEGGDLERAEATNCIEVVYLF